MTLPNTINVRAHLPDLRLQLGTSEDLRTVFTISGFWQGDPIRKVNVNRSV